MADYRDLKLEPLKDLMEGEILVCVKGVFHSIKEGDIVKVERLLTIEESIRRVNDDIINNFRIARSDFTALYENNSCIYEAVLDSRYFKRIKKNDEK